LPSSETGTSPPPALFSACRNTGSLIHRNAESGFTLIELLVVFAVILLLAGLLLSSLQAAQGKAKRIHCTSNLRQMGVALQVYVQENGFFPLATAGDGLGNWQRALRTAATDAVLYCPQWERASDEFLQYFPTNQMIYTHYGYNVLGAVRVNPPPKNPGLGGDVVRSGLGVWTYVAACENWVRRPSQMIAFGDSPTFERPPLVPGNLTPADPLYLTYPFVLQPENYYGVNNSHNSGANMIFCDGHVEYAKQSWWLAPTDTSKCLWNNDNQSHPEFQ
jgi:prepilin-type processing-associated H-X9-DG protein/prepilin-type N-terminal cleavage/methylation domain-containing protein